MFTKNYWLARKWNLISHKSTNAEKDAQYCRYVNINGNNCYLRSGYGYSANTDSYKYGNADLIEGYDWGYRFLQYLTVCQTPKANLYADMTNYTESSACPYGIYFGTGTEAPTINDCILHGDIVTTFTYSVSKEYGIDDNGVYGKLLFTLTNTGTDAITISEVGMLAFARSTNYRYSSRFYLDSILMERTLLETPITIEPGGVGQVTYTIRQNFPSA